METAISGTCDPRFADVRDAFAANFAERGEVGAAVHVIVRGEVVVDLVGGWADESCTRAWRHDTLVNFYSVGKAIIATLVLQLVDAGVLSLDAPIAEVWPEFAVGQLAQQRAVLDDEVAAAVRRARAAKRTWSEIGAMLGVSKQAAQRKYGTSSTVACAGAPRRTRRAVPNNATE